MIQTEKDLYTPSFWENFIQSSSDPEKVQQARKVGWETFSQTNWPDSSLLEEWRRTNISHLSLPSYSLATKEMSPQKSSPANWHLHFCGTKVVSQRGDSSFGLFPLQPFPETLPEAFWNLPSLLPPERGKLESWNHAFWNQGAFVYIPRNVQLSEPITLLWEGASAGEALFPYIVIYVEEGAKATVYLQMEGGEKALWNSRVELFVGPNARLHFGEIQNFHTTGLSFHQSAAQVSRDGHLETLTAHWGSQLAKTRLEVTMAEPGGEAELRGVYFPSGRQHMSVITLQHHKASHTRSNLFYRAVARDKGYGVYQGTIDVEEGAVNVDAYQTNNNLLLNDEARLDSIPGLEIKTNELRCSHGATIAQIPEEQVFYLTARGISRANAEGLILQGFLTEVLDIAPQEFSSLLKRSIAEKLQISYDEEEEQFLQQIGKEL